MKMSESIVELTKALSEFQGNVKQPEKDSVNPHFKSKYTSLDGIVKAIHESAPKYGLSFVQMPMNDESGIGIVTTIFHQSGQYIQFEPFFLPLEKKTAQGVGSCITYGKRYSLSAAFGIVSDLDDDGNEATETQKNAQGLKQSLASDKTLGLINKLVKDTSAKLNITEQQAMNTLKVKLKKDMEWFTQEDANQAIKILQDAMKKGEVSNEHSKQ